jgi:biopolymer transport protein ExbB
MPDRRTPARRPRPSARFLAAALTVAGLLPGGAFAAADPATDNPYGLAALWAGSDLVAKAVLVIMLLMSMASWYVLITRALEQSRMLRQARAARATDWRVPQSGDAVAGLEEGSPFRHVGDAALDAVRRHPAVAARISFNDWLALALQRAADRVQARMQQGLALLATVGSTSPFIGLFGTVWGIYHALTAIGVAGQASIDKVAGPVGEALIMTAIGLAVAVPAVLGYNWLVRRNRVVMDSVRGFAADLHAGLLAAEGGATPGAARG